MLYIKISKQTQYTVMKEPYTYIFTLCEERISAYISIKYYTV